MRLRALRALLILCSVAVTQLPANSQVALAQERQAASEGRLEEVIVTARRREESLLKTPVSVTAFTAEDLLARQIDRANQIAESTPNLTWRNTRGQSNIASVVYIRGIGQRDFIPTVQPGVGVYLDGVYLSQIIGTVIDIVDIQSIEVLRGPQGTLFGRNTIGGAISIVSKKPANDLFGDVSLTFGDFNRRQVNGSVNVPLTDTFYAKFSGMLREKDGYIDTPNVPNDDGLGGDDTKAARLALRWMPSERFNADLTGDFTHVESDGPPRVLGSPINETSLSTVSGAYNINTAPLLGAPLITNATSFVPRDSYTDMGSYHVRAEADIWSVGLTLEWLLGKLRLKSITSKRDMETFDGADGDHSLAIINHVDDLMDGKQFSQELQLSGTGFGDKLQWVTGLYYFENEVVNLNPVHFPGFTLMSGSIVDNQSAAAFGQFTYALTDKATLTVGARYTDERLDSIVDDRHQFISSVFDPTCTGACAGPIPDGRGGLRPGTDGYRPLPIPPAPGAFRVQPNAVFEADQTQFEPHFNLAYQWTDNLMTYVSYSEGFKGGGFTQRIVPGRTVQSFGPEFAKVYEVGSKWQGFEGRLRVTGAVFFTDYTDLQVAVTRVLGGTVENAGDAEIKGAELEVVASPAQGLQLAAGAGYMDEKYTRIDPAATVRAGNEMPSVMDWQINGSVAYSFPVSGISGNITARADWKYVSGHFDEADNILPNFVPAYDVMNAGLTYAHDSQKWEVALQGRNVLDEVYHTSTFLNGITQGYTTHLLAPPAEYAVRFAYRF